MSQQKRKREEGESSIPDLDPKKSKTEADSEAESESELELLLELHEAIEVEDLVRIKRLISQKAQVNERHTDAAGRTALHAAAKVTNPKVIQLLLDSKADITVRSLEEEDSGDFFTPFGFAVKNGNRMFVEKLLAAKSSLNSGFIETTPLMLAATNGDDPMIELLLKSKAPVDDRLGPEGPSICCAIENGHVSSFLLLMQAKADLNAREYEGDTPLHIAVIHKFYNGIYYLCKEMTNVDVYDKDEDVTPLHIAAKEGDGKAVALLLAAKANACLINKAKLTPASVALAWGHATLGNYLKDVERTQRSFAMLAGLHARAGGQSPIALLQKRSTIFDFQVLRLPLRLAMAEAPEITEPQIPTLGSSSSDA